jgi:hypothetical protein
MPLPLMAIGAALGGLGAIGKGIFGAKQNKLANKIHPKWEQYKTNPYASQQLGMAQQLFNGRMFGAANQERNIQSNLANFNANVSRNATSGSQAIALAAAGQGQADQSFANLQTQELQNQYGLLGNLNNAYGQMIEEGRMEHQSMQQKYQMDVNEKNALRGAGANNMFGALSDLSGGLIQMGQYKDQNKYNKQLLDIMQGSKTASFNPTFTI